MVDAGGFDELGDERVDARADAAVMGADEARGAERGIPAAAQVQVAFPDAARQQLPAPDTVVARRAEGPIRSSTVVAV